MSSVMSDRQLSGYFPDHYASNRSPERDFFWGVIFGVKPSYGKTLVLHAIEQRNQAPDPDQEDKNNFLVIQSDILQKMLEAPQFNCKQIHFNFINECSQAESRAIRCDEKNLAPTANLEANV